jgi:hypothetical protein
MKKLSECLGGILVVAGKVPPVLLVCLSLALVLTARGPARADEEEARLYLDIENTVMKSDSGLVLKPFIREENRFRGSGLVYQQWNAGLRIGILPWLSSQVYYTPRDLMYPGTPNQQKQVVGGDIIFLHRIGAFRLLDRVANEWHITDQFYRYRNLLQIAYPVKIKWLTPYIFDEFRGDSDQGRINMNEFGGGFRFEPSPSLTLQLFYDVEGNRRSLPDWQYVRYVGLTVAAHL